MASIRIEFVGADAQARLNSAIDQLQHPQPLMDAIGAALRANINERFETKTDPSGKAWAPITENTKRFYAMFHGKSGTPRKAGKEAWKHFNAGGYAGGTMPGSLLERTRAMRGSLTHNATDQAMEVGFNRATDGGKWQVAMLHEFGTKSMPRRGLLTADPKAGTLGANDQADVIAEVESWLSGLFS